MPIDSLGEMPDPLSLPHALAYFAGDLHHMSECDLARALCEIQQGEPSPFGEALALLLREELRQREHRSVTELPS